MRCTHELVALYPDDDVLADRPVDAVPITSAPLDGAGHRREPVTALVTAPGDGGPAVRLRPRWPVPVELGASIVDFDRRGFAATSDRVRTHLEERAGAFVRGFNLASSSWPDPHPRLATVEPGLRGFAYEGAAMSARLANTFRGRRDRYDLLAVLLDGPGRRYVHLVHVGYGWTPPLGPVTPPSRIPPTGLLRWLTVDGAGFCRAFFGGWSAVARMARRAEHPAMGVRLAGAGRALWFTLGADPELLRKRIDEVPCEAAPDLWSGVGLAMAYAGGVDGAAIDAITASSRAALPHLAQGVAFAAAATAISGVVPDHTELASRRVTGEAVATLTALVDDASDGLLHRPDLRAYDTWRARIRASGMPSP